jgi:hypothetical protein
MYRRKKAYKPYVPKLLPPQPPVITWGQTSKPQIIELYQEGKSSQEIASITGNRLVFVRLTLYRYLHPQEFLVTPKPAAIKIPINQECYCCGKTKSWRWIHNGPSLVICPECSKRLTRICKPAKPTCGLKSKMIYSM